MGTLPSFEKSKIHIKISDYWNNIIIIAENDLNWLNSNVQLFLDTNKIRKLFNFWVYSQCCYTWLKHTNALLESLVVPLGGQVERIGGNMKVPIVCKNGR